MIYIFTVYYISKKKIVLYSTLVLHRYKDVGFKAFGQVQNSGHVRTSSCGQTLQMSKYHALEALWRIQNVLMRIQIRIPLFKLMRIRSWIQNFVRPIFKIFIFFLSIILQNLSFVIFSVTLREEGLGVRDEAMRGEG